MLKNMCTELDICVSGTLGDIQLDHPVKYKLKGISFRYNKNGSIDYVGTLNQLRLKRFRKELAIVPVKEYDLVINDFEPVTAWACKMQNVKCIGLSHQSAVVNANSPKPKKQNFIAGLILKYFAPTTKSYGFHFQKYDKQIFTPVIRKSIRSSMPTNEGHYTVYLPSFSAKKLVKRLYKYKHIQWEIFSKEIDAPIQIHNCLLMPIHGETFAKSLLSCKGVICGAGFETPAEVMYLGKKLMVVPIKGQYEQACNAAALEGMGIPVIKGLKKEKYRNIIRQWLETDNIVQMNYDDDTAIVLQTIIHNHLPEKSFDKMYLQNANNLEMQMS
jgi:uncharacterized protein (TIGR00661 family)